MGGLLNFLSPALTAGTEAASANVEGQREGSALLRAIGLQQAQLAKERAQTDKDAADAFLARRRGTVPMFGDTGYNDAKGAEAGAIEGGKTPALASRAQIMAPITTQAKVAEQTALNPVQAAGAGMKATAEVPGKVAAAGQSAAAELPSKLALQDGTQGRAGAKAFASQTKAITDEAPKYMQAKTMIQQARTNPAASKASIISFAGVADQNAQLRQGMIKMIEQVDPSAGGRIDIFLNKLASGQYPSGTLDNMEKVLDAVHASHRAEYDQRRSAEVARHPTLDNYLPSSDEIFNIPGAAPSAPSKAITAPGSAKGNIYTYGGKTYTLPP